ncbi:MAG: transglycosylase family protein [Thermoleophilaceae bacterium]
MAAPVTDLAAPARWRDSLSRSQNRRTQARRRRRLVFRSRGVAMLAAVLTLVASTAALGATGSRSAQSGGAAVGSSSATVADAQRGLGVEADGVVGPATRRAIRAFQRDRGLSVTGNLDSATLRALDVKPSASAPAEESGGSTRLPAALVKIAQCESGGNPRAIGGGGKYRGKYQFSRETWRGLGGTGDPAAASESEQDRLALKLYRAKGTAPWAGCA